MPRPSAPHTAAGPGASGHGGGSGVVLDKARLSEIRNKARRQELFRLQAAARSRARLQRRLATRRAEQADPRLREERLAANVPRTQDATRELDVTVVDPDADPEAAAEALRDEDEDDFAEYFVAGVTPRVLVTSSRFASPHTIDFAAEFCSIIPDAEFVRRQPQFRVKRIVELATKRGYTDLVVINEDKKEPVAITFIHLPAGPTAHFKLSSIKLNKEIRGHGKVGPQKPELILNNFNTRLGHTVGRMFASLFPHVPEFEGRQVATFHNQRDFIFFRRHRYIFRDGKRCDLQELGPRFTLKLKWLQRGAFDVRNGDYEWVFKVQFYPHSFSAAAAKRPAKSSAAADPATTAATPPPDPAAFLDADTVADDELPPQLLVRASSNLKMVCDENYPFCTIDPNEARCKITDERFDFLVDLYKPQRVTPNFLTVVDIAGLVRGAADGEGLGNEFLSHIRSTDGLFHLVRGFDDDDVTHVDGSVDPIRDIQAIDLELRIKDAELLQSQLPRAGKQTTSGPPAAARTHTLERLRELLAGTEADVRAPPPPGWTRDDVAAVAPLQLLTAKPVVYVLNVPPSEVAAAGGGGRAHGARYDAVRAYLRDRPNASPLDALVAYSGELETHLASLVDERARQAHLTALAERHGGGGSSVRSALPALLRAGRRAVGLATFFTAGGDEVRAWDAARGAAMPRAAAAIHSDFERRFVAAEVMSVADLRALGSEAAVRAAGRCATRGRDARIRDGDVVHFKVAGAKRR
ncbi:Ribosome production factor 1 [Cladochytrium tenue]|nr:Ribosome production factor 1 [Cladochytrium tenue]